MLPEWTVVGFSGHRNLADPKIATAAIREVFDRLTAKYSLLASVSSMASGADTLFVEEVHRRNLPCLLVLPFPQTRFQQDFSPADWQRVLPLIEKAAHLEEVAAEETAAGAYMETGIITTDRADVMVVVWDGQPAAGLGGTGDVVDYARAAGKPLIVIDPGSGKIAEERLEQLPAKSPQTRTDETPREAVEKYFLELDQTAQRHAPHSRLLVLQIILFQLIAAAVGFLAMAFAIHGGGGRLLTLVELLLLGFAFILTLRHQNKHHEWMKNRITAEICRSFLATWNLRRTKYPPPISLAGFRRLCRTLRLLRILDQTPPPSLETVCDQYLKERLENQTDYFSRHCGRARLINHRLKTLAVFSTAAATLLSLVAFTCELLKDFAPLSQLPALAATIPKYLSLLLPLASAAIFSLMITQDYSRRAVRYGEMAALLQTAAGRLKQVRTWNSLARIATEVEEELLREVIEWHSFRRFAGEPR